MSKTFKVINENAVLGIDISASFYGRILACAEYLVKSNSPESIKEAHDFIKDGKSSDNELAYTLETLYILALDYQKQAEKSGEIKEVTEEEYKKMLEAAIQK